ncbi:MAG: coenzyme F420-0:L-glutamate ligase [Gammaproteobacteria bacterium]|nr:coenzyme F420-0:L-glutamate ligase [Gammaproteobacteria bacterium]
MSDRSRSLTLITIPGIPEVLPGTDLSAVLGDALAAASIALKPGDVLVVAQKIVSKAENRYVDLDQVVPGRRALALAEQTDKDPRLVEIILGESRDVVRCRPGLIVVETRHGFVMANAGMDRSNVPNNENRVLLLPLDPDASARNLAMGLERRFGTLPGIVIADSVGRAWRLGTVGTAIGLFGVPGLVDLRGLPDRQGRALEVSQVGHADQVAAAAALLMGEADEGTPVVLVRGLSVPASSNQDRDAGNPGVGIATLVRDKQADLFR